MRGDCSIRSEGVGFSPDEIAACTARKGLLALEIELSSSATCACIACQSVPKSARTTLTADEIRELMNQARELGCRRVILVDEEAEPYTNLVQVIDDLRSAGMEVELFTGGASLTPERARSLQDRGVIIALRLDSVDSFPSPFLAQVDDGGLSGPRVAIRISVDNKNVEKIADLWRKARSSSIEPRVQIITPRDAIDQSPMIVEPDRARRLFEELGRIDREEFGREWETPPSLTGRSCKRHLYACHVTACGTIFACVGVTVPLGDVRTEPLREILGLSEVLENLRAFGDKVKEPCRTCCKTTDCYGCRGAAYQLTGDYLAGDALCWKAGSTPIANLPVDVTDLIPHGPSIRMIDQLVQVGERAARTDFTVMRNSLWVDSDGRLDDLAYVEMIAQSFAASHGFHLSDDERPRHRGLLLGIKDLVISGESHVGDRLYVDIRKVTRFGDFGVVDGEVRHRDGRPIATGQIKIWRPGEDYAKAMNS